jgi:hypothetical protein
MKIEEVPQDKGYLIKGKISDLNYAVDKDGKYKSMQSQGWQPKNEAMTLAWHYVFERTEEARQKVLSGKYSPLVFYMELNIMDIKILADYAGISKWRVRRHLKMRNFKKLKQDMLAKYAEIMNMTPDELTDINRIREIELKHED